MSRESYIAGFSKVAVAHGLNPQHLANYIYAREMNKAANWFTDAFRRKKQDPKPVNKLPPADAKKLPPPKDKPIPPANNEDLTRLAQIYSNTYRPSLAKPKVYHGGKPVAR